jgi:hypothetical protein
MSNQTPPACGGFMDHSGSEQARIQGNLLVSIANNF